LESPLAPIVILATNRGDRNIKGTDGVKSPHGIPIDLLDRLVIIRTLIYEIDHMREIIKIRSETEEVKLTPEALDELSNLANRTSLRYAVALLTPAQIMAHTNGRTDGATRDDVKEAAGLFVDARESAKRLKEGGYME